ncbi:MAG: nuclear transport factor 2 family protein [Glaciimonas sp.]|nr:nuclear transport factor 2 family protein [Glaciimonas sp.]NMM36465.1 nuclear transport factor 2 family protein [Glaciimonas sp.]
MAHKKHLHSTAEQAETAFYDAMARSDLDALMAMWAEDEEIVCIHPGAPRLVGHDAIRQSWAAIFERGNVHIRPVQLHASHSLTTAVHSIIEEVLRPQHERQDMHILATNVFIKTVQGWRIVSHHASIAAGELPSEPLHPTLLH